jgi:hypothetical protein
MPTECAFCPNTADKSGEHVWSQWMDKLFAFKKTLVQTIPPRPARKTAALNWTVKVVCKKCNETWMSDIESKVVPAMTPLILGKTGINITQSQADTISLFAFKTAVILDHIDRKRTPFFPRSVRHQFRTSHAIPVYVRMWLAGYGLFEEGHLRAVYDEGTMSTGHPVKFYALSFSVGHLAFQVTSVKNFFGPLAQFSPSDARFNHLAVRFWPRIPSGVVWPLAHVLRDGTDFNAFADRWRDVLVRFVSR